MFCFFWISGEAYRINLELGRFNTPLQTDARCINVCKINPVHHLVTFGTADGRIEAWDPRSGSKCGTLDSAVHAVTENTEYAFNQLFVWCKLIEL